MNFREKRMSMREIRLKGRYYTEKSHKLMTRMRCIVLVLTSPLWLPVFLLIKIAYGLEGLLDYLDSLLQRVLDKVVC